MGNSSLGYALQFSSCNICNIKAFKKTVTHTFDSKNFLLNTKILSLGKVACCYTNGCNKNIATALGSIESQNVPSPSQAFKLQPLLQVTETNFLY